MKQNLVGISVHISPDLLQNINTNIEGSSQSERIRRCIQEGYRRLNGEKPQENKLNF